MIVHHANGLHVGVAGRPADKRESTPEQVLAHGVRLRRARWHVFHRLEAVPLGRATDELPDGTIECAEFLANFEISLRGLARSRDLEPVTDDAGVAEQLRLS